MADEAGDVQGGRSSPGSELQDQRLHGALWWGAVRSEPHTDS